MAIGAIYNSLIFGGVNSATYGIYITGEAVYNAPVRAVEMVSVPGRNGAIALDQGRWENIEVTYPAGTFGDNQSGFRDSIKAFRNAIASKIGYQKLTDTYNPNEYRMGLYMEGLDVSPANGGQAGEFEIKFQCKPQRWLTSGDVATPITSGDTLTNPTLYKSGPLLEVVGYGDINIGSQVISVINSPIGTIDISGPLSEQDKALTASWDLSNMSFNNGDAITVSGLKLKSTFTITNKSLFITPDYLWDPEPQNPIGIFYDNSTDTDATLAYNINGKTVTFEMTVPDVTLLFGTDSSKSYSTKTTVKIRDTNGNWQRQNYYATTSIVYASGVLTITAERLFYSNGALSYANPIDASLNQLDGVSGYSSVSTQTGSIIIDCDLGEAYFYDQNDNIASANASVSLGSDLPVLEAGSNAITYDNTITSLKITPRWWQL